MTKATQEEVDEALQNSNEAIAEVPEDAMDQQGPVVMVDEQVNFVFIKINDL